MSTIATVANASDGTVRMKYEYALPVLSAGLVDDAEMIGTLEPPATCAAVVDAPEQP